LATTVLLLLPGRVFDSAANGMASNAVKASSHGIKRNRDRKF
jgi:hypothetical protein